MKSSIARQKGFSRSLVPLLKRSRIKRLGELLFIGRTHFSARDLVRLNYAAPFAALELLFDGKPLALSDSAAFIDGYREIFRRRIYDFRAETSQPYIIDGGANIGLATVYFKQLYPESRITAFEPDGAILELLRRNVAARRLENVEAVQAAVWTSDGELSFVSEGGLSGHIADGAEYSQSSTRVPSVRLKPFLARRVDFLKLDIEGAEYEVIEDCRDELANVRNLFVEYHSPRDSEQKLARILQILTSAGFRYHIHEAFTSPRPFMERALLGAMDLQMNIFAYRPTRNHP